MALDWDKLRDLAKVLESNALPARKDAAALVLRDAMLSPDGFSRLWNSLSETDRWVYAATLFQMQSEGYMAGVGRERLVDSLVHHHEITSAEAETSIRRLVDRGLLAPTEIWFLGNGLEAPDEMAPYAYAALADTLLRAEPLPDEEIELEFSSPRLFSRDLARFLAYAVKRDIPVTQNGTIYKRELPRVSGVFRSAQRGPRLDLPAPWEGVPFGVYFALRVLHDFGAATVAPPAVKVNGKRALALLEMSDGDLRKALERMAFVEIGVYRRHLAGFLRHWLSKSPSGRWIALEEAIARGTRVRDGRPGPRWLTDVATLMEILALCGSVELGRRGDQSWAARLAGEPSSGTGRGFVVQPNLEVLIPEEDPLLLHFLLGQLAELRRPDEMSVYALTESGVLRLCDRGWNTDNIREGLSRFAAVPLSPAVVRAVEDWVGTYDRAVIWDVMLVRFHSPDLCSAFLSDHRARRAVVETIGGEAVIVARGMEGLVRDVLQELGAPAPEQVRIPAADGNAGGRRGGSRLPDAVLRKMVSPDLLRIAEDAVRPFSGAARMKRGDLAEGMN